MGFTPVKPFYHTSRTKGGWRAKAYRSIALLRSHVCSSVVFWQKVNCTTESPSPAVCTFNSRACCGFFCHWRHESFHCCRNIMPTVKWLRFLLCLGQGSLTEGWVNASVHVGMATVAVSVNAGAGGGDLAAGEHVLESEKSGNWNSFVTGKQWLC